MKRWLFNLTAAVSLLLCLATAGLWVRSYYLYVQIFQVTNTHVGWVISYDGHVNIGYQTGLLPLPSTKPETDFAANKSSGPWTWWFPLPGWRTLGFQWISQPILSGGVNRQLTFPLWSAVALTALPPLIFIWKRYRARGRASLMLTLCPVCGYDLRATPDRCPECGTVAGATAE